MRPFASRTDESPASPGLADRAGTLACAYVHIPFCARVCPYCDFAVEAAPEWVRGRPADFAPCETRYVDALLRELDTQVARRRAEPRDRQDRRHRRPGDLLATVRHLRGQERIESQQPP